MARQTIDSAPASAPASSCAASRFLLQLANFQLPAGFSCMVHDAAGSAASKLNDPSLHLMVGIPAQVQVVQDHAVHRDAGWPHILQVPDQDTTEIHLGCCRPCVLRARASGGGGGT